MGVSTPGEAVERALGRVGDGRWLLEAPPEDSRATAVLAALGFGDPSTAFANLQSLTPAPRDAELLAPGLPRAHVSNAHYSRKAMARPGGWVTEPDPRGLRPATGPARRRPRSFVNNPG